LLEKVKETMAALGWTAADVACYVPFAQKTVQHYLAARKTLSEPAREAFKLFLAQAGRGDFQRETKVVSIAAAASRPKRRLARREQREYKTELMRRVHSTIDFAVERAALALITADFGAGKTKAAQAWRSDHRDIDAVYYEFNDVSASRRYDFLSEIASALGLPDDVNSYNALRTFNAIVAKLREEPVVLICDQVETVKPRVLQVLRQIWDRARDEGFTVVLLAATPFWDRLQRARSNDLGALVSRIYPKAHLSGFSIEEMASIVQAEGVGPVDDKALALWFQAARQSMRYLFEGCEILASRHAGKRVTEGTVTELCGELLGLPVAKVVRAKPRSGDGVRRAAAAEEA
jgi:type II secretory pathway predicted ATPase ExeA